MAKSSSKPSMVELMEREFDLRLRMEQLSLESSDENAEEQARVGRLYAQAKADLDDARKALLVSA